MTGKGTAGILFFFWKLRINCDLPTPSAPLGVSDFQFSMIYFLQRKDLLLLFELAATKSLVEREVEVPGQEGEKHVGKRLEEPSSHFS